MRRILITGGAGFIGTNTAKYFLEKGESVTIFDNLSRKGSDLNLKWLIQSYPKIKFVKGDVRNSDALGKLVSKADLILHLAGQVAVTTSVENPREDFEINASGTLNLLEVVRQKNPSAVVIYTSTNKVYGGMEDEPTVKRKTHYSYKNLKNGVPETFPLDFHSPYGCSKGAADQYVRDYARIYGLKTIVFRQSCIYGPHQFGVEDQGWVAWFVIAALLKKRIAIYGDGKQVRDILYVDDLVRAFDLASRKAKITAGQVYNIGGGRDFSLSIWREFSPILAKKLGNSVKVIYKNWRPGDQKIYISNIKKAKKHFGWIPLMTPAKGIDELFLWARENINTISKVFG